MDKLKDLKFFLQFSQPENQESLSTVTIVGEQTLESNNMSYSQKFEASFLKSVYLFMIQSTVHLHKKMRFLR